MSNNYPPSAGCVPIADVRIIALDPHPDHRGVFTEICRDHWLGGSKPVQWNLVHSTAGVLRGVHVHRRHFDYLTLVSGRMTLGLCDLRESSPTFRRAAALPVTPSGAVWIPPGVAHGFYFEEPSIHIYAVTHYWDTRDEFGCHWADPGLAIPWDVREPVISARDSELPPLSLLLEQLA